MRAAACTEHGACSGLPGAPVVALVGCGVFATWSDDVARLQPSDIVALS